MAPASLAVGSLTTSLATNRHLFSFSCLLSGRSFSCVSDCGKSHTGHARTRRRAVSIGFRSRLGGPFRAIFTEKAVSAISSTSVYGAVAGPATAGRHAITSFNAASDSS